ncbi:hypothetical protein VN97_g2194 [Penicillium thymicola]|uniref:Uncharacterized protein n=1 Tax=Penicillium thymicola TaxID=293382 RepID=A0AAI9TQB0_PENTH|nr:hypothetical protein VN97_g2194 [Penicillium thymicola]
MRSQSRFRVTTERPPDFVKTREAQATFGTLPIFQFPIPSSLSHHPRPVLMSPISPLCTLLFTVARVTPHALPIYLPWD